MYTSICHKKYIKDYNLSLGNEGDAKFEFSPSKAGVPAHYIPHMIMSQRNCDKKNIYRLNCVPMYRNHKLMFQLIKIVRGHLMEFIYSLKLIWRETSCYGPVDRTIDYSTKSSRDNYQILFDQHCWKMAEEQGFNSLKFISEKRGKWFLLMLV